MMTQEEYMNVKALKATGWTVAQIARHLGYHPATISSWLKAGRPPAKRSVPVEELVIDERWRERIAALLARNRELRATSIMRVLRAEGFEGSYPSLTRHLSEVRGPSRSKASGGDGADRDRPRRGVPVRLVGLQPSRSSPPSRSRSCPPPGSTAPP